MSCRPAPPTVSLEGMPLTALPREEIAERVFEALAAGQGGWIVTPNTDHLRRYVSDADLQSLCDEATFLCPDGVPLLWAARLRGTPLPDRVAGSDLVWLLSERASRTGRRLFLLGGDPGVAERAVAQFQGAFPSLRIAGVASPGFSDFPTPDELERVRGIFEAAQPDLVFVALGAPKQERVIAALRPVFPQVWWVGVGISLSFVSRDVARAPRWIQRLGFEWFHRLLQEPRRLFHRYLLCVPFTVGLLGRALRARASRNR